MSQVLRLLNTSIEVSAADLELIAQAIGTQLTRDAAPAWGLDALSVVAGPDGQSPSDWVMTLTDETDPGVLGYHTDTGVPNSLICVAEILGYGGSIMQPGNGNPGVSAVVSHEALEMLVDPLATLWAPQPGGTGIALEIADPVQGYAYDIGNVSVSDFVLPTWFLGLDGKVDFMGMGKARAVSPGGYMVVQATDGSTSQVLGESIPGMWATRANRQKKRPIRPSAA